MDSTTEADARQMASAVEPSESTDGGAMSPSMRQLMLRFLESESDWTFDRNAFARRAAGEPAGS
jgi:hypothetical protein